MKFCSFTHTTLRHVKLAIHQNLFHEWQSTTTSNIQLRQTSHISRIPHYQSNALTLLRTETIAADPSPASPSPTCQCSAASSSRHLLLSCPLLAVPHQKPLWDTKLCLDWDLLIHTSPEPKPLLLFMRSAHIFKGTPAISEEQQWACQFQNVYDIWLNC